MSENQPHIPELEFVPLTPEQAELLANNPEAARDLGHVAMEGVELVGVVPATETDAAHFVKLDSDVGTRINVTSDTAKAQENYERYGSPDAVAESMYSESPEAAEANESRTLAEVAEQAGLTNVVRQYEYLRDMIETVDRVNAAGIDDLRQDIVNLQHALNEVMYGGPWAGNSVQNHPELLGRIDAMSQSMADQVTEINSRVESQQHETARYTQNMNAAASEVGKLGDETERAAFDKTFEEVSGSLQNMVRMDTGSDAMSLMRNVVNSLSQVRYETSLTVDDVRDMTNQLVVMLETARDQITHKKSLEAVSDNVAALDRLLRDTE